jgi:hypothetical protein
MKWFFFFFALLFFFTGPLQLHALIIHVPGDSTTIQGGIDGAASGDTVMVAPGTYYEYDVDFLGKAITVMGTDPEDSVVVSETVVDGDALGSVFVFQSREDTTSVLAGLTITNGKALAGGGVYCYDSSPSILMCLIVGNESTGSTRPNGGGGIYCKQCSPVIRDCWINSNLAPRGGGIKCAYSSPTIQNCKITENETDYESGGGINCHPLAYPIIKNCVINGNISASSGGGILCGDSSPKILNCLIARNTAGYDGGGILSIYSSDQLSIMNCTITGNSSPRAGGLACVTGSEPIVTNSIIWGNDPVDIANRGGEPLVTYSDIGGSWEGEGNFDFDPQFLYQDHGAYTLLSDSPCIDSGDPSILDECLPPGLGEERSDVGVYGGEGNCEWLEDSIDLLLFPTKTDTVSRGATLNFSTLIWNSTDNIIAGDYWISVLLPNSSELLVPEGFLEHSNPITGEIPPHGSYDMLSRLFVPISVGLGSYTIIGRIGNYPDTVIDEESFGFRVVE